MHRPCSAKIRSIYTGVSGKWIKINWMPRSVRHLSILVSVRLAADCLLLSLVSFVTAASDFEAKIKPILSQYCYDCHGDGMKKGQVTLDHFKNEDEVLAADNLWFRVLKNVRAGVMPP